MSLEAALEAAPENRKLGNLSMMEKHWLSREMQDLLGEYCLQVRKCGPREAVCAPWNSAHRACFLRQHDRGFYGLGHGDASAMGSSTKKWRPPSWEMVKTHSARSVTSLDFCGSPIQSSKILYIGSTEVLTAQGALPVSRRCGLRTNQLL